MTSPSSGAINPLQMAVAQLETAADRLRLEDGMRQILRNCKRELTVNFPVRLDDGRTQMFTGHRVQHNLARGPAKGGILIGPEEDIPAPDMGTDARIMAWIMDTISMHKGHSVTGVVTGKPVSIGGTPGRTEATGRGLLFVVEGG